MSTHPQSLQVSTAKQSALGFLRALCARIRTAFGADLTADLLEEGITDLTTTLDHAAQSAAQTETLVEKYTRLWTEYRCAPPARAESRVRGIE